jgi:hypothetical protein
VRNDGNEGSVGFFRGTLKTMHGRTFAASPRSTM